jgi:hypothetical protein
MIKLILPLLFLLSACSAVTPKKSDDDSDQEKENKKVERVFQEMHGGPRDRV